MNLLGQTFGRWAVIERGTGRYWQCRCACGAEKAVRQDHLRSGKSKSCLHCACTNRTHGLSLTGTYQTWQMMKQRCLNPRNERCSDYGGAGITVCDRWLNSFEAFLGDMGERPEGKTLDRFPDNDGHYEPSKIDGATELLSIAGSACA